MYSLALVTDFGSAGRTEMTFKAQQVVEILRWVSFLSKNGNPVPASTGIPTTPSTTTVYTLPWQATDTNYAFWGPAGANVVEGDKLPYQLSYTYVAGTAGATSVWIITVTATPKPVAAGPVRLYLGS